MNKFLPYKVVCAIICIPFLLIGQTSIPNIQTASWMGDVYDGIKDIKLKELKILGTHNALYERDGGANFCDQQGEAIATQFLKGARYFDTRIGYDGSFYAFHGDLCSYVYGIENDLNALKTELDNHPNEVIILDIHQTEGDNQVIADYLYSLFGNKIIPNTLSIDLTFEEALNAGQVLVLFNTNPTGQPDAFWSHSFYTSDWIGTNDNDELRDWMVNQINTLHFGDFPTDQFWIRQLARSYDPPFTFESLMSMSEGTNRRFEEAWIDENLWMSKCWNIIKLDWFGYYNHLQIVVERIARWYFCTNTLASTINLPTAYYTIEAKHSGQVLDVSGSSTSNGANVVQYTPTGNPNQEWLVEHVGKGKYIISARHSQKVLEVPGDYMNNNANVQQYEPHPYANTYWVLEEAEPNYYYVRSSSSGRVLDIEGISTTPGANVQIYDLVSGNDNQKFKFNLVESVTTIPFLETQTVAFEGKSSGKLLEVASGGFTNGSLLVQHDCDDASHQRWQVHYFGANQYLIRAEHSQKVLDGTTTSGTVYQWKRNDSQPQFFEIVDVGNGYFSLKSQYLNQYISVQNAGTQSGDLIIYENWSGGDHQQWRIVDVTTQSCNPCPSDLVLDNTIDTGIYQTSNTIDADGTVLDEVLFSAGNEVNLLPGFCANPSVNNACFEIEIVGCQ